MECILETKAATILEFIQGVRGTLAVTFEEGTCAAWLHDLLKPHVSRLVVCDPRKNALLKDGNKSDRIDERKLAELLRGNLGDVSFGKNCRPPPGLAVSLEATDEAVAQTGRAATWCACQVTSGDLGSLSRIRAR